MVDSGSNTIFVISDSSNTIAQNISVGTDPTWIAYDSGTNELFVSATLGNLVDVISGSSNMVVANISVQEPGGIVYDSGKSEIFVSEVGLAVVAISDGTNQIAATINDTQQKVWK